MKMQNVLMVLVLALTTFSFAPAQAFQDSKVQKTLRELVESPEIKAHVDRAMSLFRAEEKCGTKDEAKRPKGSKACTDLFTYDKAQAASDAELKACKAKCSAGAAGAKAPNAKGAEADLAACVDKACEDECTMKELVFKLNLDSYLKGSMMESLEMKSYFSKRSEKIFLNK